MVYSFLLNYYYQFFHLADMIHNMICESLETRMNCENENTDTKCINRILMVKNSLLELEKKIQLTLFL